jgi:hypothetical protein
MTKMGDWKYAYIAFVAAAFVLGQGMSYVSAEESKARKGLHFNVPDDWPVEKRGGVLAPIPVEEYVLKRFKQIQDDMNSLRGELTARMETLEGDLRGIKSNVSQDLEKSGESIKLLHQDMRALELDVQNALHPQGSEGAGDDAAFNAKLEALRLDLLGSMENLKKQVGLMHEEKTRRILFDFEILEEKFGLLSEEVQNLKQ